MAIRIHSITDRKHQPPPMRVEEKGIGNGTMIVIMMIVGASVVLVILGTISR